MIKILTVLLAIAFLLQIPVFVNAEVYIPDNEYVGFYDHDGVYTVIGGVKNNEMHPVIPEINVTITDGKNIFSESYEFSPIMPAQMLPLKIKIPEITSENPILEPPVITFHTTGYQFKNGYVLYDDSLVLHPDGRMTGKIKNAGEETFENFRIYALIKDENENILDVANSQKFDIMHPGEILDFEMIPHPKIADQINLYSCFAFGAAEIFPLNVERNGEQYTFRYQSGAWFTDVEFDSSGTQLSMYTFNSWHLDMNASLEFPQSSENEEFQVFLGDENVSNVQSLDEMGNWHLYFTVPDFYQGDTTIKGFMHPDGTVVVPEEIDLSTLVIVEITSGEVTGINANTIDDSIVFSLETEDDGVLSVTTSDFLIRPFNDGSFFVLVNGEETDGIKFENKILTIPYSAGTEKIEVYGSYVVPEFGTIAVFILAASVVSIIILSKKHIMPHSLSKL